MSKREGCEEMGRGLTMGGRSSPAFVDEDSFSISLACMKLNEDAGSSVVVGFASSGA